MAIAVVMAIHNEQEYLPISLGSLRAAPIAELIAILDRCTDDSETIVRNIFPKANIIKKENTEWNNSYAENLQIGLRHSNGEFVCIHDADIKSSPEVFPILMKEIKDSTVSVSPALETCKSISLLNLFYHYWEKTYMLASLRREPRGGFRLARREILEKIGGFKDVEAPDTQLDLDLRRAGYDSKLVEEATCVHLRKVSVKRAIRSQRLSGRMRRRMNMPFWRVLGHSLIRARPFVLYGYFEGEKM
jgi:glycosyltransferase involved in cell wall biosynthesis